MEITQFLGRLHPLVLHLPIGILALGFAMECLSRKGKYKDLRLSVGFVLGAGMWSAIIATGSGYALSLEGGYEETTLDQHQWLGFATTITAFIVYFLYKKRNSKIGKNLYFPLFGGLMLLLGITGHLGGTLTHGSDFLTEPFTGDGKSEEVLISNMDSALVFHDLIQPILKKKCVSCHNESKIKGDLLMSTIEGLRKGGKSGAFFVAGDVANSLFLQRVHMPMEEKKHMPPKGKNQLTKDEITLLEWWVQEGATFEKTVGTTPKTDEVETILTKYTTTDQSVFALKIEPPSDNDIQKIKNAGISIELVAEEKPFVRISLRGKENLNKSLFKKLNRVAEQVIELDLSKSNMHDDLLPYLADFPHLQKIFLQQTQITGKNIEVLKEMKYLEYLNLYDTPLEDNALEPLAQFTSLKNIYLWQTKVSQDAIEALKNTRPRLQVNTGTDKTIFGDVSLKAPIIIAEQDIFTDTVEVEFKINFRNVKLFYTLDGTLPDSTSNKYVAPLKLTKTSNIQVIAQKEGWQTSPVAQKLLLKAGLQPKSIKLNKPPHDNYKAEGAASLINLKKGTIEFTTGEWLGYEKQHMVATLDLGQLKDVSNVLVSALEATNAYIFFPKKIKISTSKDGKKYRPVAEKSIPATTQPEPPVLKNFTLNFDTHSARFIKVEVKSRLVNPDWHPAPGEPCWIFLDEILVQ